MARYRRVSWTPHVHSFSLPQLVTQILLDQTSMSLAPKYAKDCQSNKKTSKHLKTQYSYGMLWWELEGQYFWLMHIGIKHELVQGGPHSFAKNIPSCPCPRMSQAFCLRFSLSESELTDLFAAPNMRSPQSAKGDIPVSSLPCGCLWHQFYRQSGRLL